MVWVEKIIQKICPSQSLLLIKVQRREITYFPLGMRHGDTAGLDLLKVARWKFWSLGHPSTGRYSSQNGSKHKITKNILPKMVPKWCLISKFVIYAKTQPESRHFSCKGQNLFAPAHRWPPKGSPSLGP